MSTPSLCRVCYRGVLTIEHAQNKLGADVTVVEVRPAQCVGDGAELVAATEVLFFPVPYGGVMPNVAKSHP